MTEEQGWHARVCDEAGGVYGAGFLVDNRHVVTCAHVVAELAGPHVGFPVVNIAVMPATVVYQGPHDPENDLHWRGDIAVLELAHPVAVQPARFAPLRALDRGEGAGGEGGLVAYGFPEAHEATGIPIDMVVVARPRIGGEACLLKAASGDGTRLEPGFSGAAVLLKNTSEVVGMVVDHDRAGNGQGLMLPTDILAKHWRVADLVTLGPFSATAHWELIALLADVWVPDPHHLYDQVMSRHVPGPRPRVLATVQDVAECLATVSIGSPHKRRQYVGDLVHDLWQTADKQKRSRLSDWHQRYVFDQGYASRPHRMRPGVTSVLVQIDPSGAGDRTNLIISLLAGEGDSGGPPLHCSVPDEAARDTVEKEIGPFIESVPDDRPLMIEFVLPRRRLTDPVESWRVAPDDETQLGWRYPVVVRDRDRFHEEPARRDYRQRAARVPRVPLHWARCQDLRDPRRFAAWLSDEDRVAIALATGPDRAEPMDQAFRAGVPVMLWPRTPAAEHEDDIGWTTCTGRVFRHAIETGLNGGQIDALPMLLKDLRRAAGESSPDVEHCGSAVTLLWDNPARRPARPPLGLAEW